MLNPKEKGDYFKTHWTIELRKKAMETAEEIVSVYIVINFQTNFQLVSSLLYKGSELSSISPHSETGQV